MKDFFQTLHNYTSVDANTWATIFITIIVFGLGLFFTWVGKKINENYERKKYKRSLNLLLNHFAKACKKQYHSIDKSLKKSSLIENKDFIIKFPPVQTLDYLSELDLSTFISYYVTGNNEKLKSIAVTHLFEIIGNIKSIQIDAKEVMEFFGKKFDSYETSYRNSLKQIVSVHDKLLQSAKTNPQAIVLNSIDDKLLKIFGAFSESDDKNSLYNTYNFIIKPIEQLTIEFDKSPNALFLLDLIIPCHEAFINMEKIYYYLVKDCKHYAKISLQSFIRTSIILQLFETNDRISNPYSFYQKNYWLIKK